MGRSVLADVRCEQILSLHHATEDPQFSERHTKTVTLSDSATLGRVEAIEIARQNTWAVSEAFIHHVDIVTASLFLELQRLYLGDPHLFGDRGAGNGIDAESSHAEPEDLVRIDPAVVNGATHLATVDPFRVHNSAGVVGCEHVSVSVKANATHGLVGEVFVRQLFRGIDRAAENAMRSANA